MTQAINETAFQKAYSKFQGKTFTGSEGACRYMVEHYLAAMQPLAADAETDHEGKPLTYWGGLAKPTDTQPYMGDKPVVSLEEIARIIQTEVIKTDGIDSDVTTYDACYNAAIELRPYLQPTDRLSELEAENERLREALKHERDAIFYSMTRGQPYDIGLAKERMQQSLQPTQRTS